MQKGRKKEIELYDDETLELGKTEKKNIFHP